MLKCFLCWYKSDFNSPTEYVYIFAYNEQQAMQFLKRSFGLMADSCEHADLYKEESEFQLKHEAGEIWGGHTAII